MADLATSEIHLYDLPTKTVNLTPTGATVVREIHTKIQPGINEITVLGLDFRVDFDSVRIEGSGPATITDIQTEIVPRRMAFEDVHGEDEDSDNSDESESPEAHALAWFRSARDSAKEKLEKARGNERTALQVVQFLDTYGRNITPQNTESVDLDAFIERYIARHVEESERHCQAKVQISNQEREINSLSKKIEKLERQHQKAHGKVKRRRAQEKSQAMRKRQELRRFWTASVGQVTVYLDSYSSPTPGSSRRSSVSLVENATPDSPGVNSADQREVTLRLSYVVPGAKWVSRYELSINTPSTTAQLTYGAEFQNQSYETWQDARVTLSTSRTSLSGLRENIPSMQAWHVKLNAAQDDSNDQPEWEKIVYSSPETGLPRSNSAFQDRQMQLVLMEQQNKRRLLMARQEQQMAAPSSSNTFDSRPPIASGGLFGNAQPQAQASGGFFGRGASSVAGGLFGGAARGESFGQQQGQQQQFQQQQQQQLQMQTAPMSIPPEAPDTTSSLTHEDFYNNDNERLSPNLEYQDSIHQEYGLTTTYELPGRRTLVPSTVNRRHALAKLDYKSVTLQHVIVPKHRAAAFYRARIRNSSSIQILRGRVGITVDGAFLGTTNMPTCAPNEIFDISLGVDPSIVVTYAKPTVRCETSGLFVKEDTAIFRRSCWVKNKKSTAVNIVVLEQVPISNDEKLQMAVHEPKGLAKDGDKVDIAIDAEKGKGVATMSKDGEVRWMMQLGAGKDVNLVLEYEMKAPRGNNVSVS